MTEDLVARLARSEAMQSERDGRPIPHAMVRLLASLVGGNEGFVRAAMLEGFANFKAEHERASLTADGG